MAENDALVHHMQDEIQILKDVSERLGDLKDK